jgi:hypothetical protein
MNNKKVKIEVMMKKTFEWVLVAYACNLIQEEESKGITV